VSDDRQFKYLPVFAQGLAPLAALAERVRPFPGPDAAEPSEAQLRLGAGVWYALLCLAYLGTLALAVSLCSATGARQRAAIVLAALALSARFFVDNLRLGQINLIVMFLAVLGAWWVLRGRGILGGASVALAAALKFMPAVLVLWFLLRRQWRAAAAFAVALAAFVALVPMLTWGAKGTFDLLDRYWQARHKMVTALPEDHAAGQSLPSMANRLLRPVNAAPLRDKRPVFVNLADVSPRTAGRVALALVALAAGAAFLALRRSRPDAPLAGVLELGLVLLLMLMVSPETRKAHYVTALVPAAGLAAVALASGRRCFLGLMGLAFACLALTSGSVIGRGPAYDLVNAYGALLVGALSLFAASILALRGQASDNSPVAEPHHG
jgi:hypothetical protein